MARRSKSEGPGDLLSPLPRDTPKFSVSIDVQLEIDQTIRFDSFIEGRAARLAPFGTEAPAHGQPD